MTKRQTEIGLLHGFLPLWREVGREASLFLVEAICLVWSREPGLAPAGESLFVATKSDQKARLRRCPAELPSLLRRSGQTGSRKSEFLCPGTPVLRLACGVIPMLCLVAISLDLHAKYASSAYAASANSYEFGIGPLYRSRERVGVRAV